MTILIGFITKKYTITGGFFFLQKNAELAPLNNWLIVSMVIFSEENQKTPHSGI